MGGQWADPSRSPLYLNIFRLVVTIRLIIVVIAAVFLAAVGRREVAVLGFSALGMFASLVYLSFPGYFRPSRGSLPFLVTLFLVTIVIFEQRMIITGLQDWRNEVPWITDFISPSINGLNIRLALVVLVAWGYGWHQTVIFCIYVMLLDYAAIAALPEDSTSVLAWFRGPLLNLTTGLVVGYVVYRLVKHQMQQRQELEMAHQQMAQYAVTVEKLSISRERNRLARELHDTLAHALSAATVKLNAIQIVWDANPAKARTMLGEVIVTMNDGMVEVRRALRDLRTTPLEDLGLRLALEQIAQAAAQRGLLALELRLPAAIMGLTSDDEQGVYRIVQEAVENTVRHAQAQHLKVTVLYTDPWYHFCIQDDGVGFDVARTHSQSHFGLNGMVQRALLMGGRLEIRSGPGEGTTVEFMVRKQA